MDSLEGFRALLLTINTVNSGVKPNCVNIISSPNTKNLARTDRNSQLGKSYIYLRINFIDDLTNYEL